MTILDAIILGVVQGLTEFLPISSSGHLILARELFGVGMTSGLAFDAVLHFATACAVVVYFRNDLFVLLKSAWAYAMRREVDPVQQRLLAGIIIATIPAVMLGVMLEDAMTTAFRDAALVAVMLLVGSGVMYAAEKWAKVNELDGAPSAGKAFAVGFFQSLALIPGMSRSGMAIAGGMFMGLTREGAARFAFLIAVPLMLGAGAKKIYEFFAYGGGEGIGVLLVGALVAFCVGIVVIHYLLRFLRTHSMMVFVWYRVALAALVLAAVFI